MIAAVDVDYRDPYAVAACVVFETWTAATPCASHIARLDQVEPYVSGQFYRRELPCLLAVLAQVEAPLDVVVVDGFVWLDDGRPGLGAHLSEALAGLAVVGVAKNPFAGASLARPVCRGESAKPLWVTAAGLDIEAAAQAIQSMHGAFRFPTLLKSVDTLCRTSRVDEPQRPR